MTTTTRTYIEKKHPASVRQGAQRVEKATKPSEPHSSAYRGTAECGSRRKSKCSIINSFKPIPIKNRKKNFMSQKDSFANNVVL